MEDESGLPEVSVQSLMEKELKEKCEMNMSRVMSIPCTVSFAPGQEQRVYYCLHGIPHPTSSYEASETKTEDFSITPSVTLVMPSQTRFEIGKCK